MAVERREHPYGHFFLVCDRHGEIPWRFCDGTPTCGKCDDEKILREVIAGAVGPILGRLDAIQKSIDARLPGRVDHAHVWMPGESGCRTCGRTSGDVFVNG